MEPGSSMPSDSSSSSRRPLVEQVTPASSLCPQLWLPHPRLPQSLSAASEPLHATSSRWIGPLPWPKCAYERAVPPLKPSWRHTTSASLLPHPSSQTVPHSPL